MNRLWRPSRRLWVPGDETGTFAWFGGTYGGKNVAPPVANYKTVVLADSPLCLLMCDEASGTTAFDSSPNGNNGTYQGTVTYQVLGSGGLIVGTDAGYQSTVGIVITPLSIDVTAPFSFEAWVYPKSFSSTEQAIVASNFTNYGPNSHLISTTNTTQNQQLPWNMGSLGSGTWIYTSGPNQSTATDVVHHLVGTQDASLNLQAYVDGVQVNTGQVTGTSSSPGSGPISIGYYAYLSGYTFDGVIGGVAVYNYVLSSSRIAAHYAAGS